MRSPRNKRSVALDLKDPTQHEQALKLMDPARVLITVVRSAALHRLGGPQAPRRVGLCGDHQLAARHPGQAAPRLNQVSSWNPRVAHVDITGFGDAGSDASQPGFDLTSYWSRGGLPASARDAGARPTVPGLGQRRLHLGRRDLRRHRDSPLPARADR
ncbi:CoA transferase [Streptomyces sp. NPDC004680]|uniref:CoA transferase n=1 Tax=Streptomyces sp. NPDC004680 TaxID=3154287 RepID=UPI0033B64031